MASRPLEVLSIKASGTGLNLPVANSFYPFARWRSPVVEKQVRDRSGRIDHQDNIPDL
jgi:SNF2 family DNA or RNA helicase